MERSHDYISMCLCKTNLFGCRVHDDRVRNILRYFVFRNIDCCIYMMFDTVFFYLRLIQGLGLKMNYKLGIINNNTF